jgi:hypothetical protein
VNYTQVVDLYGNKYGLSPRKTNCYSDLQYLADNGTYVNYPTSLCLVAINTKREKEIGLGTAWPYEPLPECACIISTALAKDYSLTVG